MRFDLVAEPIDDDDDAIRAALECIDVIPPLVAAVAQATGDQSLLRDEFRADPDPLRDQYAGVSLEGRVAARDLVAGALARFRDGGSRPVPTPSAAEVRRLTEFITGGPLTDEYAQLLTEELALDGADFRAPRWRKGELAPHRPFKVAIIGAGMSGIIAAHRLLQAGVEFEVFEKNDDVGGTWFENTYPNCRVDIPNTLYSYSFAQTGDWPDFYSPQGVLLDYFQSCATALGIRPNIRLGREVVRADFDDERGSWTVLTRGRDGSSDAGEFHAVISAVGQLNRPKLPDIDGLERFGGPSFHSARWNPEIDLRGKRVAILGTGASAAQVIPAVAEEAAQLFVYQRTPPWIASVPNIDDPLPAGLRWLLRHVPAYPRWDRLWQFWRVHEALLPMARVDPEWQPRGRSVSAENDLLRHQLTEYIHGEFPDPTLFGQVLPTYPPLAKRLLLDNGIWARTLTRDNVELITDTIDEITTTGIRTADGVERSVDVIIYGTGFQASRFLTPMQVTGRGGVDLHERWAGNARAYLGVTVPGFPNLYLLYGPNTALVVNGSATFFAECEVNYVVGCIEMLLAEGCRTMDCRPEVLDAYVTRIDEGTSQMAWGVSEVNSWYKNAEGRVTQCWPFDLLEFWRQLQAPAPEDYVLR